MTKRKARELEPRIPVEVKFNDAQRRRLGVDLLKIADGEVRGRKLSGLEKMLSFQGTELANAARSISHPSDTVAELRPVAKQARKLATAIHGMATLDREFLSIVQKAAGQPFIDFDALVAALDAIDGEFVRRMKGTKAMRGLEVVHYRTFCPERAHEARSFPWF